jgi:ribonuclease P protein subunit RPR2
MGGKPAYQETIARERIQILFDEAEQVFAEHPDRAHRYVEIARNIAMKFNLSMPDELKERFCPHCYSYWAPGKNVRIRTKDGSKVYTCAKCGEVTRRPYRD